MQIFSPRLGDSRCRDKASLLQAIDAQALTDKAILQVIAAFEGQRIIAPVAIELVQTLQILFFGNRRQSLTEFVLQNLGVTRYYPYVLDREHRLFSCRAALDEYLDCAALGDRHYELLERGEQEQLPALGEEVLARTIRFSSSENRWHRLYNNLARDLERLQEWDLALQLYARSQRHPARERRARILEKGDHYVTAVALCEEIIAKPWCEAEQEAAGRILPRVKRKLDGGRLPRRKDNFAQIELALPAGPGSVERKAASHLLNQWQAVHYVENGLMNALFGLAIWERMLFDPGENRRGFPDLIAFGAGMGDYCMIEVKGPGDALQDCQKRWLRYFAELGIPAQVAWVEWAND